MPISTTLLFATGALLIWGVRGCKLFNWLYLKNLLISRQLLESLCSLSWNTIGESLYISTIGLVTEIRYSITVGWLCRGQAKLQDYGRTGQNRRTEKCGSQISRHPDVWVWIAFNWKYLLCVLQLTCLHPFRLTFGFSVLISAPCLLHLNV